MLLISNSVLALAFITSSIGVTLNRCFLARQMDTLGVPKSEIPQWACIAQHESAYRTEVVGPPNSDESNDYGIFQINDFYWCQPANGKFSYNGCQLSCNVLLSDNINNSVSCARRIRSRQGWTAWSVWPRCNGSLPSIDDCF